MEYNVTLFNALTDALEALDAVKEILITAQQQAEDAYISEGD